MRTVSWLALIAVAIGALALVGIPVWLIQPFAPQSVEGLSWSHALRRVAPAATAATLLISLVLGWKLWQIPGREERAAWRWRAIGRRAAILLVVLLVAGTAWFSRQNHFEWMFRPNADPSFDLALAVSDVDAHEPVIGVTLGSEALAFPVTRIGYHHLVNTTIASKPIVATY
jgi:hypothetical protein